MKLSEAPYFQKAASNRLAKKGIITEQDLLESWIPRKYLDFRNIKNIKDIETEQISAVYGILRDVELKNGRAGKFLSLKFECPKTHWRFYVRFFSGYYVNKLYNKYARQEGVTYVIAGKIIHDPQWGTSVSNPDYCEKAGDFKPHIECVYPKTKGISQYTIDNAIDSAIFTATDPFEQEVVDKIRLYPYKEALKDIHRPQSFDFYNKAKARLIFDDLVYLKMSTAQNGGSDTSNIRFTENSMCKEFIQNLPFSPTADQIKCIEAFMELNGKRLNALLQGDVGCGKTIVAVALMVLAHENGYQAALIAPRQVLASQHAAEIQRYADELGVKMAFLSGTTKASEKKKIYEGLASGKISIVVGTHACLSKDVEYKKLGVIVVDEEHLFGVSQKQALQDKALEGVHMLAMSATPIPRTLCDVLYGENKDILTIKTKPQGRKDIITTWTNSRAAAQMDIDKELSAGHQCYVVCPAINDNEDANITSIEEVEAIYRKRFEPKYTVGVLHGELSPKEVEATIEMFKNNEIQILISTTVIEVGVNVPNTTVMAIEQADRFGLASMHQLRGRVGRNSLQSYCILISEEKGPKIEAMLATNDGFLIAQEDLKIRGAGNLLGTEQSGYDKFVDEMLAYPKIYDVACKTAKFCLQNGYGKELIRRYDEHYDI